MFLLKMGCVDPKFTNEAKSTVKVEKQQSVPSNRPSRVRQVEWDPLGYAPGKYEAQGDSPSRDLLGYVPVRFRAQEVCTGFVGYLREYAE